MVNKLKKFFIFGVAVIMSIGLLAGCEDKKGLDISGESTTGKPMSSVQVRAMIDEDVYNQEDNIELNVGFGFRTGRNIPYFVEIGTVVIVTIECEDFIITDENDTEYNDKYEKEFTEYSDEKFVCSLKCGKYIPNYYETFRLKLNQINISGAILISAVNHVNSDADGQTVRIYYTSNNDKIAFSSKSIEDAQKKLK